MVYATGHFRNGVLLAPLTSTIVADLILDGRRDPALTLTTPDRFQGYGGTRCVYCPIILVEVCCDVSNAMTAS